MYAVFGEGTRVFDTVTGKDEVLQRRAIPAFEGREVDDLDESPDPSDDDN